MKKVIVYGVYNLEVRRKIECMLNDDSVIIGYMDTYAKYDIADDKNFIAMRDLENIEYDYILLTPINNFNMQQIKRQLVEAGGVREDKIINPVFFKSEKFFQRDLVSWASKKIDDKTRMFIHGLSYSLRGIDKSLLKLKTHDFSWHGLDLYYNYKLLQYTINKNMVKELDYIIMVFPYYYFNYDMSVSAHQYDSGQILSVYGLNDLHNREKMINRNKDYEVCEELFARKFLDYYRPSNNLYMYRTSIGDSQEELSNTWKKFYIDTVNENKTIYKNFIDEAFKIAKNIIMIVPPMYIKGIKDIKPVENMRNIFYEVTQYRRNDIKIIDLFENKKFQQNTLFSDYSHLNYYGAQLFTDEINNIISK